ncbi:MULTISPECIES: hypothetical protein [unclassified Duganella]
MFLTVAWYGHLKNFSNKSWLVAAMGAVYFILRS